ncbi:MAG: hypothetical protein AAFQ99_04085 [Pseudomonadota bacterium]
MVAVSQNISADTASSAIDEHERLLRLFSNRVALKKAYSDLRQRERQLNQSLAGAAQHGERLERKLAYLEELLTGENTALGTMLFYHLRGLWRRCHQHLVTAAHQMATRTSGKRRVERIEEWRAQHAERVAAVEQQLVSEKASIMSLRQLLRDLEAQYLRARYPWHWWRRRRLTQEKRVVTEDLRAHVAAHDETLATAREVRVERPPADRALPIADQRVINLHLLAMAQFMTRFFESAGDLAAKSRLAYHREVGAVDYGDDAQCRRLMNIVDQSFTRFRDFTATENFMALLRTQVQWLAKRARYAADNAVIPDPFDADPLNMVDEERQARFTPIVEVLRDDQWSVSRALITDG